MLNVDGCLKNKTVGDMIVERVVLDRHTHNMNFILKDYC